MNTNRNGSLFQPAAKTERYLKVLLHGVPGTGKTLAALSFPGPLAVIDLEGGTALYDGDWAVLRTKDITKIEAAIAELGRGGQYRTVVIDPLTVLWQVLQDAGQGLVDKRRNTDSLESGQALSPREWGIIKRRYASILTRLTNLPMHVVLIARDTDLYEGKGDQLTKVGTKADVEKSTAYVADFVLWCQADSSDGQRARFSAVVEKSRSALLPIGTRLTDYSSDPASGLFAKHLAALAGAQATGGARVEFEEEAQIAARNTAALETDLQGPSESHQERRAPRETTPHAPTAPNGARPAADVASESVNGTPALISAADKAKIRRALDTMGWGDTDRATYLRPYGVAYFSELSAEQAAKVVPDLEAKAEHIQRLALTP